MDATQSGLISTHASKSGCAPASPHPAFVHPPHEPLHLLPRKLEPAFAGYGASFTRKKRDGSLRSSVPDQSNGGVGELVAKSVCQSVGARRLEVV